jgi:hypothetical protein
MVSWLEGAKRAKYKDKGLLVIDSEEVTDKLLKRKALSKKQSSTTTNNCNELEVRKSLVVGLFR